VLEVMPIVSRLFLKLFRLSYRFNCKECKVTSRYIRCDSMAFIVSQFTYFCLFITYVCVHKKIFIFMQRLKKF